MVETADYDPGPWKGHNFASARRSYDAHANRSYADARSRGIAPSSLIPATISTESSAPLIIVCDVTGSMGEWPAVMFSKLPYLEIEGKEYLGPDMEICWAAVGDAHCGDNYPLQVRGFTSGLALKDQLEKLIIEGGGGGQGTETYELAALYLARNVRIPNAIHQPIIIFIGDEKPYDFVDPENAQAWSRTTLEQRISTAEVFAELRGRFTVYLIRKPYQESTGDSMSKADIAIRKEWADLLGEDHIADLPDPNRVVDVIFGLLARETGRIDYFRDEIEGRQNPDQVEVALRSLDTLKRLPSGTNGEDGEDGRSVLRDADDGGERSRPLL